MINFNHLHIFHKVAEKRHYTRAAEALHISQPAVSKQVHELERTLGQPLFDKIGRTIRLTEAGKLLYDYACRIFTLAEETEAAMGALADLAGGRLAVGASTTIGIYMLPQILGRYKKRYPRIELCLDIGNAEEIQAKLLANRLDAALVEGFVTSPALFKQEWRQDELVLIAHTAYPLPASGDLSLRRLFERNDPFILREKGSGTREVMERALTLHGLGPIRPVMELGSTEAIKQAVTAGLGISFVSEHTIKLEAAAGLLKVLPLADFSVRRPLYLVYVKAKSLSRAAQAFLDMLFPR